jgi:hypothetical protein
MKRLSVQQAVGRFDHWLERVSSRHESFEVVDEGVPCALLVPAPGVCSTYDLADDLTNARFDLQERRAFGEALRKSRKLHLSTHAPGRNWRERVV